jgi:hypothetical protein
MSFNVILLYKKQCQNSKPMLWKAIFTSRWKTAGYSKEIQEKILFFDYELLSRWKQKAPFKHQ